MRGLPHLRFKWAGKEWFRPHGDFDATLMMCVLEEVRGLRQQLEAMPKGEDIRAGIDSLGARLDELWERLGYA